MSTAVLRPASLPRRFSRRFWLTVFAFFGVFVLLDMALFGWLILESLSERELEEILLETEADAAPLTRILEDEAATLGQDDLFVVVSVSEETQTFIDSVLAQHEVVRTLRIENREGAVVFEQKDQETIPVEGGLLRPEASGLDSPPEVSWSLDADLEREVPIGDLGTLVIGFSRQELEERVGVLRRDLVRQASLIGGVTLMLLALASAAVVFLYQRTDRLEAQAAEAERLAYVGRLASGLAHEIRNPLNSLNLNMQMLEEEAREQTDDPGSRRLLAITRSEIGRLESLVTDFLSYARPRPLDLTETTARELFERVLEVMSGELRKSQIEARIIDESGSARFRVDRDQMAQLFLNLTQNALAAMRDADCPPRLELRARTEAGGAVALEVVDNGAGIAEEELGKIFELFYSTRKGGTGLGLSIVERIARMHGAEVQVESELGTGTTVRILVPPAPPTPDAKP